jgi:hypothetical protein
LVPVMRYRFKGKVKGKYRGAMLGLALRLE